MLVNQYLAKQPAGIAGKGKWINRHACLSRRMRWKKNAYFRCLCSKPRKALSAKTSMHTNKLLCVLMNYKETWQVKWDKDVLYISGTTDLFPNNFSTSTLIKIDDEIGLSYRIAFNRDKEPYCNKDLVGPVNYIEHNVPNGVKSIKIYGDEGEYIELPIPKNT